MTKRQLAKAAGVSIWTLQRWMKTPYMQQQLAPFKLTKKQQILPPKAAEMIADHYAIEIN